MKQIENEEVGVFLNLLSVACNMAAKDNGWHNDPVTGEPLELNKSEQIALMHSELSEVLEGERKGETDKHLPHRRAAEVELADVLIRVFHYAGYFGYDVGGAFVEKLEYNRNREDHKPENRKGVNGKKF